jgi:3-hydroxyacyl-CoA dehydrogenase/enoyl-CoA hydratase/3-hydroxybutyryl-CoA epimerase
MTDTGPALRLERRDDGIAILWIDDPQEPVNTLKAGLAEEFRQVLDLLQDASAAKALVIISAKPDNFIAGANLEMLRSVQSIAEGRELAELSQSMQHRLACLPMPVVAAIHGACLGGGLELALAADARVASNQAVTRLGLPEVQLGLLPGGGGTQRLLHAEQALVLGLVDAVVPREQLLDAAIGRALAMRGLHRHAGRALVPSPGLSPFTWRGLVHLVLARNPIGRQLFFARAKRQTMDQTRGNYPAPERILEVVRKGFEQGRAAGYSAEARAFGELVVSPQSRALVRMFFATRELAKDNGVDDGQTEPRAVDSVGLLGAGLMGVGIAYLCAAAAGSSVTIRERDQSSLDDGLQRLRNLVAEGVKRKRLSAEKAEQVLGRVTGTLRTPALAGLDLVIEAVFEDLALKRELLHALESSDEEQLIFASNTSSIPISDIAAGCRNPANVIGMHYFSPAERMPLLEVVVTEKTAASVTATCVAYGKRQGKTVIVVRDGAGFYTSRILTPYLNEAAWLVSEGIAVECIDRALRDFGFPLGPLALLDEIGIDVGQKVSGILGDAFGPRMQPPQGLERLLEEGQLGKKAGCGFYRYDGRARRRVNTALYDLLDIESTDKLDATAIAERCVLPMINEAARCLESGILRNARDGDVGAVFGLGFPPFLGGPFRYADALGAGKLVGRMEKFADRYGERYLPAEILLAQAERGRRFYAGEIDGK